MELICKIENPSFKIEFEKLLESLAQLYYYSEKDFNTTFLKAPKQIINLLNYLTYYKRNYVDTEYEDLVDFACEVNQYYKKRKNALKEQTKAKQKHKIIKKYKPFTLRNPDDLKQFDEFLDKMLELLDLSPGHFIAVLPECPVLYWDKMDDLRETSYKLHRDSQEYIACLQKCKKVSFAYSDIMASLEKPEEEFYDLYENENIY